MQVSAELWREPEGYGGICDRPFYFCRHAISCHHKNKSLPHGDSVTGLATRACYAAGTLTAEGKTPKAYLFEAESGGAHWRDWIRENTQGICRLAGVREITAHALRGLLATITAERGMAGHLIAATLGHEEERTTFDVYAAPGAEAAARTGAASSS